MATVLQSKNYDVHFTDQEHFIVSCVRSHSVSDPRPNEPPSPDPQATSGPSTSSWGRRLTALPMAQSSDCLFLEMRRGVATPMCSALFSLPQQSRVAVTETVLPAGLNIVTVWGESIAEPCTAS